MHLCLNVLLFILRNTSDVPHQAPNIQLCGELSPGFLPLPSVPTPMLYSEAGLKLDLDTRIKMFFSDMFPQGTYIESKILFI